MCAFACLFYTILSYARNYIKHFSLLFSIFYILHNFTVLFSDKPTKKPYFLNAKHAKKKNINSLLHFLDILFRILFSNNAVQFLFQTLYRLYFVLILISVNKYSSSTFSPFNNISAKICGGRYPCI